MNSNKESIEYIEQYINKQKHIFTGTLYENSVQSHFKFKPGLFLLSIPKALERIKKVQKKREKQTSQIQQNENDKRIVNLESQNNTIEIILAQYFIFKKTLIHEIYLMPKKCLSIHLIMCI